MICANLRGEHLDYLQRLERQVRTYRIDANALRARMDHSPVARRDPRLWTELERTQEAIWELDCEIEDLLACLYPDPDDPRSLDRT